MDCSDLLEIVQLLTRHVLKIWRKETLAKSGGEQIPRLDEVGTLAFQRKLAVEVHRSRVEVA